MKIIRYIKSNVNILYMKVYFRVISLIVENKGGVLYRRRSERDDRKLISKDCSVIVRRKHRESERLTRIILRSNNVY